MSPFARKINTISFLVTFAAKKATRCELDVNYGANGQQLDIYYPPSVVDGNG